MIRTVRACCFTLAFLLSGCAANPSFTYHELSNPPSSENWVPFQLTDTVMAIGSQAKTPGAAAGSSLAASAIDQVNLGEDTLTCTPTGCSKLLIGIAAPVTETAHAYAIEPVDRNGVKTLIYPTYFDASSRLKGLAVDVKDQRKEIIDTVAGVAIGIAKLAVATGAAPPAKSTDQLHLPIIIALADAKSTTAGLDAPLPGNAGWYYQVKFLDNPAVYRPRSSMASLSHSAVSSACRPVKISIHGAVTQFSIGLVVADPDYLASIPLPQKGAIAFHDLCGMDVTAGSATTTSTDTLVTDIFSQIGNLANALKPATPAAAK